MKILTVIGARPQFIKSAPVSRVLATLDIEEVLVHTGQHYDRSMSDVFFADMGLSPPSETLQAGGGSHGEQTAAMLIGLEKVMIQHTPDVVIVYGDTNSTLAGTLSAAKLNIPLAHVEAGLRSRNLAMPEEINRLVADRLSSILFAPTAVATANLRQEGYPSHMIAEVGDVMLDALRMFEASADRSRVLEANALEPCGYVVATVHRAENTDNPETLGTILEAMRKISEDLPVVFPLHPRTRKAIAKWNLIVGRGVTLTEPLGFLDMMKLVKGAAVVATDSGGLQKEAFWLKVPCVTLRAETEWLELVEVGANVVCAPSDSEKIISTVLNSIGKRVSNRDLYGNGRASEKIAELIKKRFAPGLDR